MDVETVNRNSDYFPLDTDSRTSDEAEDKAEKHLKKWLERARLVPAHDYGAE